MIIKATLIIISYLLVLCFGIWIGAIIAQDAASEEEAQRHSDRLVDATS